MALRPRLAAGLPLSQISCEIQAVSAADLAGYMARRDGISMVRISFDGPHGQRDD